MQKHDKMVHSLRIVRKFDLIVSYGLTEPANAITTKVVAIFMNNYTLPYSLRYTRVIAYVNLLKKNNGIHMLAIVLFLSTFCSSIIYPNLLLN